MLMDNTNLWIPSYVFAMQITCQNLNTSSVRAAQWDFNRFQQSTFRKRLKIKRTLEFSKFLKNDYFVEDTTKCVVQMKSISCYSNFYVSASDDILMGH